MHVRAFDWRDLPFLLRNRSKSVYLNSYLLLTRGTHSVSGALLSSLAPSMGVITCIGRADSKPVSSIIAQTFHRAGSEFSKLTFLTPADGLDSLALDGALDYLVTVSGERGALHMLADVDESSHAFEVLRSLGYATYTRQRVWRFADDIQAGGSSGGWQPAVEVHAGAIYTLYHSLVPGMVKQVEPYNAANPRGMVYYLDGDLLAYVEFRSGHRGIWMQPFFHPDIPGLVDRLRELIAGMPERRSRPGYLCVRSYQAWLDPALEELGAQPGPSQAVLVKHLAVSQKADLAYEIPAIEGRQPEITAPIMGHRVDDMVQGR